MPKIKIAISSPGVFSHEFKAKISKIAPDYELLDLTTQPTDALLAECEILFGNVQKQVVQKMTNLKWVHAQTAGVDIYIGSEPKLPESIQLTNSTGAFGVSIGEHMLTVTLMLLRNAGGYLTQQKEHIWKWLDTSFNIYRRRITVVGMGDIGGRYAYLCNSMGATVNGVVRNLRAEKPSYVSELFIAENIDDAIQNADVVALALPGTGETTGILSRQRLANMKKGAFVVNVGRGSAIDQEALIELLQNGHLGGAALDVTIPEPLPQDNPLWDMPNVIITPHVSHGGRDNTAEFIAGKFLRYLEDYIAGRPFERIVDRVAGY